MECGLKWLCIVLVILYKSGLAATCCRFIPRPSPISRIHANDGHLQDVYGRTRLFHGVNAVEKKPPWYPDLVMNSTRLRLYRQWGFNVIRLGTMWAGVQPEIHWFNDTYIRVIKNAVRRMRNHDMHVILDMHQDVISSAFGEYDGVPRWLVDAFPSSPHAYPWPLKNITKHNWADGYLTQAVGVAFQSLYNNVVSAVDYMANFWTRVAISFRDELNIIGYELINEPWAGDVFAQPALLLPGKAGRTNLQPLYKSLNEAIRRVDTDTLIFYEPVTWGVMLNGKSVGMGFDYVPGGPAYRNRSVLSYHYYCWILNAATQLPHHDILLSPKQKSNMNYMTRKPKHVHRNIGDGNHASFVKSVCDKLVGPQVFATVLNDVRQLGGSSFLTEFGLCDTTDSCEFVADLADEHLQSWTYWDADFFDDAGNIRWPVVRMLSRPYARAVAGRPQTMSFNRTTRVFAIKYLHDGRIDVPTEVFVPAVQYENGFYVTVSEHLQWEFDDDSRILYVTTCRDVASVFAAEVKVIPFVWYSEQ